MKKKDWRAYACQSFFLSFRDCYFFVRYWKSLLARAFSSNVSPLMSIRLISVCQAGFMWKFVPFRVGAGDTGELGFGNRHALALGGQNDRTLLGDGIAIVPPGIVVGQDIDW